MEPRRSITKAKAKTVGKDVAAYLARVPQPARATLENLRAAIAAAAPKAEERISYGVPTFFYFGMLGSYGYAAKHCAFYGLNEAFKAELAAYDTSRGTIRFPHNKPLPKALVTKIIKARVADNEDRQAQREAKKASKKKFAKPAAKKASKSSPIAAPKKPSKKAAAKITGHAFPAGLSQPSLRALAHAGIADLKAMAKWTETDLLKLHGLGPKTIKIVKPALAAHGLAFRKQ